MSVVGVKEGGDVDFTPLTGTESPFKRRREFPMSERDFVFLASLASRTTGIELGLNKAELVYTRVSRRIRQLGLKSFSEYVDYIQRDANSNETTLLINSLTTNLTRFFRSPEHFSHLRNVVIPDCLQVHTGSEVKRIRFWSSGCSTGEEAYSIAISALQSLGSRLAHIDLKILATDIDTAILAHAEKGEFGDNAVENVSADLRRQFFVPVTNTKTAQWRVKENVRNLVRFKKLNLHGSWPMRGQFDAVYCRNVLIYFSPKDKQRILKRFAQVLRPGGWLYLGSSESVIFPCPELRRVGSTIYQRVAE